MCVAREKLYSLVTPEKAFFRGPKVVPEWVVLQLGNARIEPHLFAAPAALPADVVCQSEGMVIRVIVPEGFPACIEQVLAVYKGDGSLWRRGVWIRLLRGWSCHREIKNPARGL